MYIWICRQIYFHNIYFTSSSFGSEAPLPGPLEPRDDLPVDLTDLELFKKYCMPVIMRDPWDDVSYLKSLGGCMVDQMFSLLDTPKFLFHM